MAVTHIEKQYQSNSWTYVYTDGSVHAIENGDGGVLILLNDVNKGRSM
jgi:succinyl-CoA synthetase beta subunit